MPIGHYAIGCTASDRQLGEQEKPYTFELADWKTLVETALPATRAGNLVWMVDESPDDNGNALQLRAQKGLTAFTLFGRLRGFSYKMTFAREADGQSVSGDEIKVTNQMAAEGIPFDLLFRAAIDQIRLNEIEAKKRAAATSLAQILVSIDLDNPMSKEELEALVPIIHDEDCDTVIDRSTHATRQGEVQWEGTDGAFYSGNRGGLTYALAKEPNPAHGCTLWVDSGDGDVGDTRQWDDSSLERLAEAVGIHTRNTEAQFAAMAKASDLEAILEDITSEA